MYNQKVIDEFRNPQNAHEMPDADCVGEVGGPECGDIMRVYLKIKDGVVTDASFLTFGCASAIATSSVATRLVKGKTIAEALKVTNKQVVQELGELPAQKYHCSVLAEEAIKDAIDNYYKQHPELKQ
ncbi:MAG: iron-sulfur cluster assembly scaffold protein [Firmicutes bacterium]|nr:iron-sulfur cluster assembly scaffold protein [Bacillota bacterium]